MAQRNADNRALILQRALDLFATRGYDAIGVQEICEAAGVTKPTLYHYYGSKRGLLEALVTERCAPLVEELTAATDYQGNLPMTLRRVVELYFSFAQREPTLYRLLLTLWLSMPDNDAFEVVVAFNLRQHQLIEAMFLAATRDHGNMRGRERTYAATFLGMINTYIAMALNGYLTPDAALVRQAVQQFSHGIYS